MPLYQFILIFLFASGNISYVYGNESYGTYEVYFTRVSECHSPKPKDLINAVYGLNKKGNIFYIDANITVLKPMKVEMMKISVSTKHDMKRSAFTYCATNPCKHMIMGPAMAYAFNTTDSCVIKRGIYKSSLDVSTLTKKIHGYRVYGEFIYKTVLLNKKGNIFCVITEMHVVPAGKNTSLPQ